MDRRATEELIPLANELDVGVVIMKALGGCGAPLTYPQWGIRFLGKPEEDWPDRSEFVAHFGRDGMERAERTLRFVLAHEVDTVAAGIRSTEQVDYLVKVGGDFSGLTDEERLAYRFGEFPPEPFCRDCGLCVPCPDGVGIPMILKWDVYYGFYDVKKWRARAK